MPYISKKLVRLVVMDALDEVIKGNVEKRLSKDTQLTIIEAVEVLCPIWMKRARKKSGIDTTASRCTAYLTHENSVFYRHQH